MHYFQMATTVYSCVKIEF